MCVGCIDRNLTGFFFYPINCLYDNIIIINLYYKLICSKQVSIIQNRQHYLNILRYQMSLNKKQDITDLFRVVFARVVSLYL